MGSTYHVEAVSTRPISCLSCSQPEMQSATAALERARQPLYGMNGASPTAQASTAFLDNVSERVGDFLFFFFSHSFLYQRFT